MWGNETKKGDCSSCHYSVLFDDRYSTIYASLTVASWYQNFEKKLLNNWEKKIILFFKWLHHLTTYFLIPQPILVTANCMLGPFSLPQVSDVAHGALVFNYHKVITSAIDVMEQLQFLIKITILMPMLKCMIYARLFQLDYAF